MHDNKIWMIKILNKIERIKKIFYKLIINQNNLVLYKKKRLKIHNK